MKRAVVQTIAVLGLLLPIGLAGGLAGCAGYRVGGAHVENVRTVAVPIFENTSLEPGIERLLTEAIIRRIQRSTPYRVTAREVADTIIAGEITEVRRRSIGRRQGTGFTEELTYELVVDVAWIDARSGEPLADLTRLRGGATFSPPIEVGESIEVGQFQAYDRLAERIVDRMLSDW